MGANRGRGKCGADAGKVFNAYLQKCKSNVAICKIRETDVERKVAYIWKVVEW